MASIIPTYEYDIFISYRQKDNRSDQWVTNFVKALREELDATFKEEVSIYFDSNPHDGLLENHDVDASLTGKLKCLIFIPIVSQTYCDPASFAWQKEFLAFIDFAKGDQFGLDIKLLNGNVAKRVLPVRIHEIDEVDKKLFEHAIGGVLRPVDFIFKSVGVNRPLRSSEDHPHANVNKTFYRDQINKVANAIKEIITSLKTPVDQSSQTSINGQPVTKPRSKKPLVSLIILVLVVISAYFLYRQQKSGNEPTVPLDKSIAVLSFVNMSNDPEQEYFSDGISEELINALTKLPNLKVMGRTSSFYYKGKNENLKTIGSQLGVSTILEGSVRKSGNTLRITAQLINAENGFQLWTETYERELTEVFRIQDEITEAIIGQLKIQLNADQLNVARVSATSLDAYDTYMKARQELAKRGEHLFKARELFEHVIELDSTYSLAYSGLGSTLALINVYFPMPAKEVMEEARVLAEKAIALNPANAEAYSVKGSVLSDYDWNWKEGEKYLEQSYSISPNDTEIVNFLGDLYCKIWHPGTIAMETRALALDPLHPVKYADLAIANYMFGRWEEGIELGKHFNSLDPVLLYPFQLQVLAHCKLGQLGEAERMVKEYPRSENTSPITTTTLDYLTAWIAIDRGETGRAMKFIPALDQAVNRHLLAPTKLALLYLKLDMPEKSAPLLEKAYQTRDFTLIADNRVSLPEDISDHPAIRKALDKPELNVLFEIRRKNTKLLADKK